MLIFSNPNLKIPPPVVTLLFGLIMYGVSIVFNLQVSLVFQGWLIGLLLLSSVFMLLPAVIQFYQNKTTVNPLRPEKANKLVVDGLYRFSRNPMYLGMALILAAWAVYLANPLNILVFIGFIAFMNRFQIRAEELALEKLFAEDFVRYKHQVRRWI